MQSIRDGVVDYYVGIGLVIVIGVPVAALLKATGVPEWLAVVVALLVVAAAGIGVRRWQRHHRRRRRD